MRISLGGSLAYALVGLSSLALAVFLSSFWLKPTKGAIPSRLLAQVNSDLTPPNQGVTIQGNQASVDTGTAFLEPFLYDTREGRRNPFKPAVMIEPGNLSNVIAVPATPLERFEIDELRLLAIIWDVKNPKAMFRDPTNEIHTVGKDDRIGRRRGYIAVIREGEVVVVESTTYGGEPVYTTRVLRLDR